MPKDPQKLQVEFDNIAFLKAEAVQKIEHALRCIRAHEPPLWDIAAGSLAIALEHVRTLYAIAEKERRAKPKRITPPAEGGRA